MLHTLWLVTCLYVYSTSYAAPGYFSCQPVHLCLHDVSDTRRSLSADHDGPMRPSSKEARSGSSCTYLLSRTRRQTTHELLSSVIGDHIIFSESTSMPGVPIVFRPPEERAKNPERLNLDRLVTCASKCSISEHEGDCEEL